MQWLDLHRIHDLTPASYRWLVPILLAVAGFFLWRLDQYWSGYGRDPLRPAVGWPKMLAALVVLLGVVTYGSDTWEIFTSSLQGLGSLASSNLPQVR